MILALVSPWTENEAARCPAHVVGTSLPLSVRVLFAWQANV